MPVSFRYDENIIVIEMSGEYSVHELRSTVINAFADSSRLPNAVLMIDLSESKSFNKRSSETINSFAHFIGSFAKQFNKRIAFIAPDDLKYGLVRMGVSAANNIEIEVEIFREYLKAREWLITDS
jgi:hypothetical protein